MTCISLDLRRPEPPEPWRAQPEPRPEPRRPALAAILIVEDDETVREVTARMLMDAGYDVVTAGDGVEALVILESQPEFDILITDIRMPRMGGHALSHRVLARRPDLPIIYISGYAADWQPAVAPGRARAFLRKPFTEQDLLRAVESLLGDR